MFSFFFFQANEKTENVSDNDSTKMVVDKPDFQGFSPILKPSQIDNAINVNNVQVVKPEPINNAPDVANISTESLDGPDVFEQMRIEAEKKVTTKYLPDDNILHIITLEEEEDKYVTSAEISMMIPKFKKRDVLQKMLQLRKQIIPRFVVEQDNHQSLWEECIV